MENTKCIWGEKKYSLRLKWNTMCMENCFHYFIFFQNSWQNINLFPYTPALCGGINSTCRFVARLYQYLRISHLLDVLTLAGKVQTHTHLISCKKQFSMFNIVKHKSDFLFQTKLKFVYYFLVLHNVLTTENNSWKLQKIKMRTHLQYTVWLEPNNWILSPSKLYWKI